MHFHLIFCSCDSASRKYIAHRTKINSKKDYTWFDKNQISDVNHCHINIIINEIVYNLERYSDKIKIKKNGQEEVNTNHFHKKEIIERKISDVKENIGSNHIETEIS